MSIAVVSLSGADTHTAGTVRSSLHKRMTWRYYNSYKRALFRSLQHFEAPTLSLSGGFEILSPFTQETILLQLK